MRCLEIKKGYLTFIKLILLIINAEYLYYAKNCLGKIRRMNYMLYKGINFELMQESDIDVLTPIMKRAFDKDTQEFLNEPTGGPEGYDNGNFLRQYGLDDNSTSYKMTKDELPIGAIIVWINNNGINYLGNMFVDPLLQDKGIGSIAWEFLKHTYPETTIWRTDTPGYSKRNHNFYINKCRFHLIEIKNPRDRYEEIYILEKRMNDGDCSRKA